MRAKAIYLLKALARRVRWAPSDLLRLLRGDRTTPPRRLSFVGAGDFEQTGREFLGYFTELGGLRSGDRVLDMGCGIGRMALPLTAFLEGGSYAGFDVGREMIGWCRRNITPRHPEFEFTWAPVYNRKYNPFGGLSGSEFRFPYESSSFDFAFATSLFTHLLRDEVSHYLAETARVLRPGGRCLLTFFLLTPEAERQVATGEAMLRFSHPVEGGATIDPRQPEEAVAFRPDVVREMLSRAGLAIEEPIHPGLWANAPGGLTLQDIVVAGRPG
ncbi:MAG TPA: class I SAM-dependent methyltransferase [Solirubrobacterales bacterium]